jgi:hypothetical protein
VGAALIAAGYTAHAVNPLQTSRYPGTARCPARGATLRKSQRKASGFCGFGKWRGVNLEAPTPADSHHHLPPSALLSMPPAARSISPMPPAARSISPMRAGVELTSGSLPSGPRQVAIALLPT